MSDNSESRRGPGESERKSPETLAILIEGYSRPASTHIESGNQDSHSEGSNFSILCDGLGGHADGALASTTAVAEIQRVLESIPSNATLDVAKNLVAEAIVAAESKLNDENMGKEGRRRMGTTASVVYIHTAEDGNQSAVIGNVGDSRVYLDRGGELKQITTDDGTLKKMIEEIRDESGLNVQVEEKIRQMQIKFDQLTDRTDINSLGTEFWRDIFSELIKQGNGLGVVRENDLISKMTKRLNFAFDHRNWVTQNLGEEKTVSPRMYVVDIKPGDKFVSFSDGLTDPLTLDQLQAGLRSSTSVEKTFNNFADLADKVPDDDPKYKSPDDRTMIVMSLKSCEQVDPNLSLEAISESPTSLAFGSAVKIERTGGVTETDWKLDGLYLFNGVLRVKATKIDRINQKNLEKFPDWNTFLTANPEFKQKSLARIDASEGVRFEVGGTCLFPSRGDELRRMAVIEDITITADGIKIRISSLSGSHDSRDHQEFDITQLINIPIFVPPRPRG